MTLEQQELIFWTTWPALDRPLDNFTLCQVAGWLIEIPRRDGANPFVKGRFSLSLSLALSFDSFSPPLSDSPSPYKVI